MEWNFSGDEFLICIAVAVISFGLLYASLMRTNSNIIVNSKEFDGTMVRR
jgi:hypothetical protein